MKTMKWDAVMLVGVIFAFVGALFAGIGIAFFMNLAALRASAGADDIIMLPIIFTALGSLFVIIGLPMMIHFMVKRSRIKKVIASGSYIFAQVKGVRVNVSVTINGRHPQYCECQYTDPYSGVIHVFRSDNMQYCPDDLVGREVRVWVDKDNYKYYHVDMESLGQQVVVH